jgi:hypothetical protein
MPYSTNALFIIGIFSMYLLSGCVYYKRGMIFCVLRVNLKANPDPNSTRLQRFRSFLCLNERSLKANLHERTCKVNFF